jgi:polyisoprenyl-phosphate glycosyltransferase
MNNVNYISLDNKFGQYAALTYGLSLSKADAVITMDVDGGHPIETAIEMIKSFLDGII